MSSLYAKLQVLIVDDFNSFRMTLSKIMHEMGFRHVDSVASGEEALNYCRKRHYDLILSDYNLGQGKNGQQFLEELRINGLLQAQDIFILLSAETSRNVVMSAYDCEPDAYLTKPITTKVIQQRLKRLMGKRMEMLDVYTALSEGNKQKVIASLEQKLSQQTRYGMECQKLLAELYVEIGELDKAEKIYRTVLEMRSLDWAQVGLAKVKVKKGEPKKAVEWLNKIIEENPSCMRAYDTLSEALSDLGDSDLLQKNLEKAVDVSPMSLGRQVSLANIAMENGDTEVAAKAYRKTIKYGANSCHDTLENQLNYVKSVAKLYDTDTAKADDMSKDVDKVLSNIENKVETDFDTKIKAQLLNSQLCSLKGEPNKSRKIIEEVNDSLSDSDAINIDIEIEMINALIAGKQVDEANRKLKDLVERSMGNQADLEKIDPLLQEPVSEKGKKRLARANKRGIDAYKSKEYDASIDYFSKIEKRYPRYIGVKLNLVQALVGKIRAVGEAESTEERKRCDTVLKIVERVISADSAHYDRYRQLKEMLNSLFEKK